MSHIKNPHTIKNPQQQNQYPLIKPSYVSKINNQERLKEVYKSASVKQKQKSKQKNAQKFYLPLHDKKIIQKDTPNPKNSTNRYQAYLQGQQSDEHYHQQYSQRYQPRNTKRYEQSQQSRKNDASSNLQIKLNFRRKIYNQLQNNQSLTSRHKDSSMHLQNQLYHQLNQNFSKKKNLKNMINIQEQNLSSRQQANSRYEQNTSYQKQIPNIRRSTKKSFSGSLSKKPSEDHIREDLRLENHQQHISNAHPVTKSQMSSPKNSLLQQGKTHFKNGDFISALATFYKGRQQHPKNLQFSYNIALVHLKSHQYQQGLKMLQQIISHDPSFKKTVYLFAVISLKNLNLLSRAISMANKGLEIFWNFVDLIFYRGKLFKQVGDMDNGLADMQRVLLIEKNHVEASYYSAYFYYSKGLATHAMSALSSAIYYDQNRQSQMRVQALKLRAKLYFTEDKIKQAKKDIQKVIEKSGNSAESYFLMGKILIQENNVTDALINFEKCLRQKSKANNNPSYNNKLAHNLFIPANPSQYLIPSLLEICKTKIQMKDFYSAYHHINRSKHLQGRINEHDESLLRFKYFIEGVVFLMKRKIDEGMRNFQRFIEVQQRLKQRLKQTSHSTPATSTQTYQCQQKNNFNPAQIFQKSQLEKQLKYFYPAFYLYRAFGYFMQNKHELAIKDYEMYEKHQVLDKYTLYNLLLARGINKIANGESDEAIDYFNKAGIIFSKTETKKTEPYIYRAIASIQAARTFTALQTKKINGLQVINDNSPQRPQEDNQIKILELVFDALKQLDKAYDINEGNSNLLFIRSLIYAYLNKLEESLDDIIKCISKSEQNVPKYFFFRGLIQSTMQNKKQAMNDFNIALNLDGNYAQVYLERAKLNFHAEHYSKAFQDLAKYSELKPQEDEEFYKAVLYFVNRLYPMAEQASQLIKDQSTQQFKQLRFFTMLKRGKMREAQQLISPENQTDRTILKIIQNDLSDISTMINSQTIITFTPMSKTKYFDRVQYYHFLGVAYFNLGQYQRALEQFSIALKQSNLKELQNGGSTTYNSVVKKLVSEQDEQGNSRNLGDRDANCIMYNIFLCHLQLSDLRKAYEVFITQIMPVDEKLQKSQFMANFSHLLFQAMKRSSSPKKSQLNDGTIRQVTEDLQQAHVQLFSNSMTDMFSKQIVIDMSTFLLRTKLSYLNIECESLIRQYGGRLCPEYVLTWLNVKEVENRPQPPWVKRQALDEGLVFTDRVQNISIEFQTTQHDDDQQEQQDGDHHEQQQQEGNTIRNNEDQQQYQMNNNNDSSDNINNNSSSNYLQKRFDPRKFRDRMKLGDSIQRKLNKIVNKQHQQF